MSLIVAAEKKINETQGEGNNSGFQVLTIPKLSTWRVTVGRPFRISSGFELSNDVAALTAEESEDGPATAQFMRTRTG